MGTVSSPRTKTVELDRVRHQTFDRGSDLIGGIKQMLIVEMRVARCGLQVGVAQQPSDDGQCFLVQGGMAGKCVVQVMDAPTFKIGLVPEFMPATDYALIGRT